MTGSREDSSKDSLASMVALHGQVAAVAGGAGAIGAAICARLLECGARVYSLDLAGKTGPAGSIPVSCNITDAADVQRAVEQVDRAEHRLDIVIHAAGITRDGRLWKSTAEDWALVVDTNLSSAFHLLRAAVPMMRRTGEGRVLLISSINGERGKAGQSSYGASKAGLNALARTAARELGFFGIRVNALAPGWIDTPMTQGLSAEIRQRALDESALGRLGQPDDVARVAVVMVSDLSRHITGQVLRVDGGQLIG